MTTSAEQPDWRALLFARRLLGMRPSTEPTERVLDLLLPGVREHPPFAVVHVVGTNGKGSSSAMIDHGLRARGLGPVGLFTSPHLELVGERMRIDGRAVEDQLIERGVEQLADAERRAGVSLSFFEVLFVLAMARFVEAGCRVVVSEAGLGGRFDATSAVRSSVVAVAHIAFDHEALLGNTLTQIAGEKAGVIRSGVPTYSVQQDPEARVVLEAHARDRGAPLQFVEPLARAPIGLPGEHQRHNAALALAVVRTFDAEATPATLDGVRWPGRLERLAIDEPGQLSGQLWLDVAHNLDGVQALCRSIEQLRIEPAVIVFGTMADKPAVEMAARLRAHAALWLTPPARTGAFELSTLAQPGERSFLGPDDPSLLAAIRAQLHAGANVLVCGSHYLVGAVRARLRDASASVDGPEHSDPVDRGARLSRT